MSKDAALKVLGLSKDQKTREGIPKKLTDYSEEEVQEAFQANCSRHSEWSVA
jgi:hypothetical protein